MYAEVKTWDDLCKTNLDFIDEKINKTFYSDNKLDAETVNTSRFLNDIIELNKKGIFTYASQPGNLSLTIKQKSYIKFACEYNVGMELVMKLLVDNDIYFMYQYYSDYEPIYFDNFPQKKYNLTSIYGIQDDDVDEKWIECSFWNKEDYIDNLTIKEPILCIHSKQSLSKDSNVYKMLSNAIHITIVHKEYDETFSAPKKLLKIINRCLPFNFYKK
jgi:hypothetical protein